VSASGLAGVWPEQAEKKKAANSLVQLYPLPQITPFTLVIFLNRMETDESAANS
jgi:hypothetical protein